MDPHSFIARAEAQRWLGIAEKLLISHDLVGSKTFAIRARESDPRLEPADQILTIADTLLAAEKRVVGNNGSHQPDYYAILQLNRFVQDTEHITSQYRRLAVLLNPHQNRFPYSDQAFQLVNDAWAVLSNPMRKSMYDSELGYLPHQQMNTLGFNIEQQQQQQQQQAHNFFSINHMGGGHEQELPEQQQQTFQSRVHQSHHQQQQQLQQHNFLSQPNPVRPLPVREQEHMFQHSREQEHLFQPQVQPFQVTSPPHQQNRPSPQPPQQQSHIQSPPATPQPPFSWPQARQQSQSQFQIQHQQIKQEQQNQHHIKQEQQMQHQMKQEQQKQQQLKQEQLKQQQLQQEQLKQQQLLEEQRKQQQLLEEQRKQQQLLEEQRKQQQLQEEQRKQQQLLEEQRKQQQLLEEQRKQQQLQEEQRKQQQILEEQRKQQQILEEQRKQQQILEEQRKQQQILEEQRKQQQILEEQRKQQQILEEQRKQQQLLEEQRKQQQILEEQRKQQQILEEQRKQQQILEEQRKQQQLEEEQRKQQQLLEEQRKQQQLQEEQRKQQEQQHQESVKQNAAPVQPPSQINSNNGVREETETEAETEPVDDSPTFWTACPYCFYMYEYPRVYVECTLRCDNCKRAFQAVRISSPPPIIEGQDAYFYCWGFFPIGLSMSDMQKNNNKGTNSNWTPFSSLHTTSNNAQNHLNEQAAPKENPFVNKSSGPRIYIDDITDDVFLGVSDPSSDSDVEWNGTKKQKSKRMDKGFKERIQVLALRAMYTRNGSVENMKHGIPVQECVEVPTVLVVETKKKIVGSNPRKQSGQVAQEMGKLDLNVEFNNNEGEETALRRAAGTRSHQRGEEDNIEGIGFFEGLDEYLSSLPILSVVNEEKVKVA